MDNCVYATERLLTSLEIKSTSEFLKDSILSHPDHPSLLCISDTLEKYNIETLAIKIDADKLEEMPIPCIVQVEINRQPLFFVLKSVYDNKVSYFNDKNKLIETSKEDFYMLWTGICLLAEANETSKEKDIEKKITAKRTQNILKGIIIVLLVSLFVINFIDSEITNSAMSTIFGAAYILAKVIGLIVAGFLLWFDIDQYNPVLQSFCSGSSKKINCNAVLNSKHSKLFNGSLSLSLLSVAYFFGTLIYLTIYNFSPSSLSVTGIISFTSISAILFSVYYQSIVLKQWCKFCIVIGIVLVAEIGTTFFSSFYKTTIAYETLPILIVTFLIPILSWGLLKPLLEQQKETNLYKRGLKKLKNNPDVFGGLLMKSRKIETSTEGLGISLLSDGAKYHITKVCNPYCGPCEKAHPILEGLVNSSKINLQILFTVSGDEKDPKTLPVSHFLAIDEKGDKTLTQKALDDWYEAEQKDYAVFANKYPMNGELEQQKEKIIAMNEWCKAEHITHTPTIFINGYELPNEYNVEDLKEVLL